jgi:hypothetical protein
VKSVDELIDHLAGTEITSIVYEDPRIKLTTMAAIVETYLKKGLQVHYLDYDLQYSSLLQNSDQMSTELGANSNLLVLQPKVQIAIPGEIFKTARKTGAVIIDSLNTMQSLFAVEPSTANLITANKRTALLISAIQLVSRSFSKTMLLSSIARQRPSKTESEPVWERTIVGGRMTDFKSDVIISGRLDIEGRPAPRRIIISVNEVMSKSFRGSVSDEYEVPF